MTLTPFLTAARVQELASAKRPRQGINCGNTGAAAHRAAAPPAKSVDQSVRPSATKAGAERRNDRGARATVKNAARVEKSPVNAHFTRIPRPVEALRSVENDCRWGIIYSNCKALFAGYDRVGMDAQQSL
jgi:hypothetical protein